MENKKQQKKVNEKMAKDIVAGDFVMIKSQPCVVIETLHSKPGKHVMKASIKGQSLITRRKMEQIVKLQDVVEVVYPKFSLLEVVNVNKDEMVSLLDKNLELKVIKLQDDDQLKKNFLEHFSKFQKDGVIFHAKVVKVKEWQEIVDFKVLQV